MWMCNSLGLKWTLKYCCFHSFETAVLLEARRSTSDAPLQAAACILQVLGKYIELSDILTSPPARRRRAYLRIMPLNLLCHFDIAADRIPNPEKTRRRPNRLYDSNFYLYACMCGRALLRFMSALAVYAVMYVLKTGEEPGIKHTLTGAQPYMEVLEALAALASAVSVHLLLKRQYSLEVRQHACRPAPPRPVARCQHTVKSSQPRQAWLACNACIKVDHQLVHFVLSMVWFE